jgi:hypothetical protein
MTGLRGRKSSRKAAEKIVSAVGEAMAKKKQAAAENDDKVTRPPPLPCPTPPLCAPLGLRARIVRRRVGVRKGRVGWGLVAAAESSVTHTHVHAPSLRHCHARVHVRKYGHMRTSARTHPHTCYTRAHTRQVAAKVKELESKLALLMEKKKQAEKEAAEKARLEVRARARAQAAFSFVGF